MAYEPFNGAITYRQGALTGAQAGQVLRS